MTLTCSRMVRLGPSNSSMSRSATCHRLWLRLRLRLRAGFRVRVRVRGQG